jgi:hypothetical protein
VSRKSYIQVNGKLIPKEEFYGNNSRGEAPLIMGDIEPFVSPVTKEVIRGRSHLRQHMKEHGITHADDYSPQWYEQRQKERIRQQEREGRRERIEIMKRAMEK